MARALTVPGLLSTDSKWTLPVFEQLAREGYHRILVWRSIAANLDTPLSVYLKLAE